MAKALDPEDCLRGGQIQPSERVISMLGRYGFKVARQRSSHITIFHPVHRNIQPFNLVKDTDKLAYQVDAAKNCKKAARFDALAKRSPEQIWLQNLAQKLNSETESFTQVSDAIFVHSLDWPALGVRIPNFSNDAVIAEKIATLRENAAAMESTVNLFFNVYGISSAQDEDGTLRIYQPDWRMVLVLPAFDQKQAAFDALAHLKNWEVALKERLAVKSAEDDTYAFAEKLRNSYPDQTFIVRSSGKIIMHDTAIKPIGAEITMPVSEEQLTGIMENFKSALALFAGRLQEMANVWEFSIAAGRRTTYLHHVLYSINDYIKPFEKTGDIEAAHVQLDKLVAETGEYDGMYLLARDFHENNDFLSETSARMREDGLLERRMNMQQSDSGFVMPLVIVSTPYGRITHREHVRFYQNTYNVHFRDLENVIRENMGFSTELNDEGTLVCTHMAYGEIMFSIPDFKETKNIATSQYLVENFSEYDGKPDFIFRYEEILDKMALVVRSYLDARSAAADKQKIIHRELEQLGILLAMNGYKVRHQRVDVMHWWLHIEKSQSAPTHLPQALSIPYLRIRTRTHQNISIFTPEAAQEVRNFAKTVTGRTTLVQEKHPAALGDNFGASVLGLAPAPQQDVPSALAAVVLPRARI